ncbi:hypothetical protein C5Y97_29450 [Blastopirellula marina]|uniref:Uncharacterized protein n=1 Tax=Blastopirellula marina TaxID=124 RepID=A0A2S8GAX0_9BACT|nr:hypothetical protein C5Y98_29435 [Blastopirellula marina]PQO41583.1 hypothetical protein C5Y93_31230 [Blastopirellula marina]PTL41101.1 hypothetical protein C5Y97_29450 [Blastopirellula marina]
MVSSGGSWRRRRQAVGPVTVRRGMTHLSRDAKIRYLQIGREPVAFIRPVISDSQAQRRAAE